MKGCFEPGGRRVKKDPEVCAEGACAACLPATADLPAAVQAMPPGATLALCAGRWALTKTVDIEQDLTLIRAETDQTILDGGGIGDSVLVIDVFVTATVQALTITGGHTDEGGGIDNFGDLTLVDVAVTGNSASYFGGGIENDHGTLTLVSSRVTDNIARDGGGIANDGALMLQAGSRVTGNAAGEFGGGIYHDAFAGDRLTVDASSRVTGNTAVVAGGGVYVASGPVDIAAASVTDNTPNDCAGAIAATCVGCASGFTVCLDGCADLATDRFNCGACGRICAGGVACVKGRCEKQHRASAGAAASRSPRSGR